MIILFNGAFISEKEISIAPTDRGFTLGDAVFDTMLSLDGKPQHADRHMGRLLRHADALKIPLPIEGDLLEGLATELLGQNSYTSGRHALRTTLTRGPGTRGLWPPETPTPTLMIQANPVPEPSLQTVRLIIAKTIRRNESSPLSRIKSANYGDNLLALMEAKNMGADDALLLNSKDHITCATTSNVFIENSGQLYTPPLSDGVLDGVMRELICEQLDVREESLSSERVTDADGIYLTNSIAGVRKARINGKQTGNLLREMQDALRKD